MKYKITYLNVAPKLFEQVSTISGGPVIRVITGFLSTQESSELRP